MRKMRLFLACFIAACTAVPLASPASAQEPDCSSFPWVYVWLVPPLWEAEEYVELGEGTITIRGDRVAARAAAIADHYVTSIDTFVRCTHQAVDGVATPFAECVAAAAAPILSSPDPVARYVQAGTDLVVTIDYGQALVDAGAIANCTGTITHGG